MVDHLGVAHVVSHVNVLWEVHVLVHFTPKHTVKVESLQLDGENLRQFL